MLVNLHVKNFAIIDEADVDFGEGLNILTGETGAGKSILIGSLGIALGGRVSPEVIGRDSDSALVEAVFSTDDEGILGVIRDYDIDPEDGQIVISRKISDKRSTNRINGVTVPASTIKHIAGLLIDIHGQNDNQSLLRADEQRRVVDRYGAEEIDGLLDEVAQAYTAYAKLKKEIEEDDLTPGEVSRQIDRLTYIRDEIEGASLTEDELANIDEEYKKAAGAGAVVDALSEVYDRGTKNALDAVSRVIPDIRKISSQDEKIKEFEDELMEIESLLGDFNRDVSMFMQDYIFDEGSLRELEKRVDLIHSLQSKYGETYEDIHKTLDDTVESLSHYEDYENYRIKRDEEFAQCISVLDDACERLSSARRRAADRLADEIAQALKDLNFANSEFGISITEADNYTSTGRDDVEFVIATNPGEPLRSLSKIASGGELSRVMLAIKSVFAEVDDISTMIFDEIDAGISGRTAQMVSEKMLSISRHHQIICITHLAQIAAMADTHFVIEKEVGEDRSKTYIRRLDDSEVEDELARILGGVEITDTVRENAKEMKRLADGMKDL